MRVRKLGIDGDYQFGRGNAGFHENSAAGVAQDVMTRLALWQGTWFIDTSEGTPYLQGILGKGKDYEPFIRERILDTEGVTSIESLQFIFDPRSRRLSVTAEINTAYGEATVSMEK